MRTSTQHTLSPDGTSLSESEEGSTGAGTTSTACSDFREGEATLPHPAPRIERYGILDSACVFSSRAARSRLRREPATPRPRRVLFRLEGESATKASGTKMSASYTEASRTVCSHAQFL